MKMRQSLAQFEAAFHEQAVEDRLPEEVRSTSPSGRASAARSACRSTGRCVLLDLVS
jgi:hypothetical protein